MTARERHLLRSYGITQNEYDALSKAQKNVCAICGNPPKTRSLHVDHEHVKGYKKMAPELKRGYIRGLLCFTCNWILLSRGVTLTKGRSLVSYLEKYERRRHLVKTNGSTT